MQEKKALSSRPIFPSGCEGKLGVALAETQRKPDVPASPRGEALFRLERGPGIALQAMQEKKALSSRPRTPSATSPTEDHILREGALGVY